MPDSLGLLDMLSNPIFLAIERQTEEGLTHLIYEAIAPKPTHFQELGMNIATPTIIRREMLQTIDQSWGRSDERWIDIVAVPMHHRMDVEADKVEFTKTRLGGLVGAKAHILSPETIDHFLSIKNGASIADLLGFAFPLKVNMQNLVRYHSACLGFTGSGKSNFTSHLIREAMKAQSDLRVVIFDLAGEYFVHLADKFAQKGMFYSSEPFDSVDQFLDSQVIPETLEEKLQEADKIQQIVKSVMAEKRLQLIETGEEMTLTLGFILDKLTGVGTKAGAVQAAVTREKLKAVMTQEKLRNETPLATLKGSAREKIRRSMRSEFSATQSLNVSRRRYWPADNCRTPQNSRR
jgi:hypothetical protein